MLNSPTASQSATAVGIDRSAHPRLLVSVRDDAEAAIAIAAGVELLDVKDPARGPLGYPSGDTLIAISARLAVVPTESRPRFTIACGELREWTSAASGANRPAALPRLAIRPDFAKFGTTDLISQFGSAWPDLLESAQRAALGSVDSPVGRILVAYAEEDAVGAPSLEESLEAVVKFGWDGLLIDTARKNGGRLFDLQSSERLGAIRRRCEREGVRFALAGRLTLDDIERVVDLRADIVGVRSAACLHGDRGQSISHDGIVALRQRLDASRR